MHFFQTPFFEHFPFFFNFLHFLVFFLSLQSRKNRNQIELVFCCILIDNSGLTFTAVNKIDKFVVDIKLISYLLHMVKVRLIELPPDDVVVVAVVV